MWTTINLLSETEAPNENGFNTTTTTSKTVYAERNSIRSSEFYSSSMAGMKVDIMFKIRLIDYSDEQLIDYNSKQYQVIRTYAKDDEWLEVYCRLMI